VDDGQVLNQSGQGGEVEIRRLDLAQDHLNDWNDRV
jgi:hypothetical protein